MTKPAGPARSAKLRGGSNKLRGMPPAPRSSNASHIFDSMRVMVRGTEHLHSSGVVRMLSALTLERPMHPLIAVIAERGEARVGQVADDVGLSPSVVSRYAIILERRGLIARRVDPNDSRAVTLTLTPAGVKTREDLLDCWDTLITRATADWTDAETGTLADLLRRFGEGLHRVAEAFEASGHLLGDDPQPSRP